MKENEKPDPLSLVRGLKGLGCWYVSCGGAAGTTFQLALGEKIPRAAVLKNPAHPEEYRLNEGEANLLVWCSWRLDGPEGPLTSSDDTPEGIERNLARLLGAKVRHASLTNKSWDLQISFSNRLKLIIFCDHVPGDPSFDGNWDLSLRERALFVGPGDKWVVEEHEALPVAPHSNKAGSSVAD
jgi:hypothetical protein